MACSQAQTAALAAAIHFALHVLFKLLCAPPAALCEGASMYSLALL